MERILLIEDDTDLRERWTGWLAEAVYEVIQTKTPLEACTAMRQERPDLIIWGARLQDSGQAMALHEIKETDSTIPVVLHTEGSLSENDLRYELADTCVLQTTGPERLLHTLSELTRTGRGQL